MCSLIAGVVHSGIGPAHLNKVLACANIPTIDFRTYKRYENEVGPATERVAKESCSEATPLERELTLKHLDLVQNML